MKLILQRVLIEILAFLYPDQLIRKATSLKEKVYSKQKSKLFKVTGKNFHIGGNSIIAGEQYITVGENFQAFGRFRLEAIDLFNGQNYKPSIIIGNDVSINFDCHITAINSIKIGDNVLIGSKVIITDHSHGQAEDIKKYTRPLDRALYSKGGIVIHDNVWIGEGVAILPGVTIGENSIIGANSVVTRNVPKNSIVAGNPSVIIKK